MRRDSITLAPDLFFGRCVCRRIIALLSATVGLGVSCDSRWATCRPAQGGGEMRGGLLIAHVEAAYVFGSMEVEIRWTRSGAEVGAEDVRMRPDFIIPVQVGGHITKAGPASLESVGRAFLDADGAGYLADTYYGAIHELTLVYPARMAASCWVTRCARAGAPADRPWSSGQWHHADGAQRGRHLAQTCSCEGSGSVEGQLTCRSTQLLESPLVPCPNVPMSPAR